MVLDVKMNESDYIAADTWIPIFMNLISDGKEIKISPHGYSMYPLIASDRDEVVLKLITEDLKRGDVVLYRRDSGQYVLHRIHHIKANQYYMVGDSQSTIEGPLRRNQILAIASAFIRKKRIIYCSSKVYRLIANIWLNIIFLRSPIISSFKTFQRLKKRISNR